MLRHERKMQDENAGVFSERHLEGKRMHNTPLGNQSFNSDRQKGLGSSRKAFGDTSNNGSTLAQLTCQGTTARRALGDITNATPQHRPQRQVQAKAAVQAETVAGVMPAAGARDVAEVYAEEGTESCAGMTWRQQAQLQERQQDAEIAARVRAFASAPFRIPHLLPSHRSSAGPIHGQEAVMDQVSQPGSSVKFDLDALQPEDFMLQCPTLDWTFGGTFPVSRPEVEGTGQE